MWRLFLKHCSGGDYIPGLVQASAEATRSRALSPLIVSQESYSPWTLPRLQLSGVQPAIAYVTWYFDTILITTNIWVIAFYDLSAWDSCWSFEYIRRFIYKCLNVCPFDCTTFARSGKVGPLNLGLTMPVWLLLSLQLAVLSLSVIVA